MGAQERGAGASRCDGVRKKQRVKNLTLDDLLPYFEMPIEEAAEKLGCCSSALKRRTRKLGIKRWPYRKLHSSLLRVECLAHFATSSAPSASDAAPQPSASAAAAGQKLCAAPTGCLPGASTATTIAACVPEPSVSSAARAHFMSPPPRLLDVPHHRQVHDAICDAVTASLGRPLVPISAEMPPLNAAHPHLRFVPGAGDVLMTTKENLVHQAAFTSVVFDVMQACSSPLGSLCTALRANQMPVDAKLVAAAALVLSNPALFTSGGGGVPE